MARTTTPDSDVSSIAEQVSASSRRNTPSTERTVRKYQTEDLVNTGSTVLNLACSDNHNGGFLLGSIVTIPGASSSGKTILSLTTLAEASVDSRFEGYDLIHDDSEERMAFDLNFLFGERVAQRIVPPYHGNSAKIEHFRSNILHHTASKRPFIYILDSFDSLKSDDEMEKEMKRELAQCKSDEAARKIAGTYGMERAKITGQILRMANDKIKDQQSLLIVLQQRRQKTDTTGFGEKWTTSGGEAPFFYSTHQVWMDKIETIKECGLVVGSGARARLKKNSLSGKLREAEFDIFNDYGVDDTGSCVDFLLKETEHWKKCSEKGDTNKINARELGLKLTRGDLIRKIESREDRHVLLPELKAIVAHAWRIREDAVKTDRSPRFL